jgi:hypothetical protein
MEIADDDIDFESRVGELLERGLERYGEGDLEGALSDWKHVLVLDPENEKAAHYSTYVEDNHDLAESEGKARFDPKAELDYPFGLEELGLAKMREDELDDYESFELVEVAKKAKEKESKKKSVEAKAPSVDEGWNVDEGWVSDLVDQTESAFEPEAKEEKAAAKGKEEEAAAKAKEEEAPAKAKEEEAAAKAKEEEDAKEEKPKSIEEAFAGLDLEAIDQEAAPPAKDDSFELGAAGSSGAIPGINELELEDSLDSVDLDLPSLPGEQVGQPLDDDDDDDGYAAFEIGPAANDVFVPGDDDLTGQHLVLPSDEGEDDRAPTQDPELAGISVRVDEALLSLEDSTREIELGDSLSKRSPSTAEPSAFVFDARDEDDFAPAAEDAPAAEEDFEPATNARSSVLHLDDHDEVMAAIDLEAPTGDDNERTAFVVGKLIEHALSQHGKDKHESASVSIVEALSQADDCAAAQKLVFAKESELVNVLISGLCDPSQVPELVVPLTEIPLDEIDNRAAFLLTRVDGVLSLEEILVISGMSKLEALRHLSRMHQRSYLSVS